MNNIPQYFTNFSDDQLDKIGQLEALYSVWNSRINVISRKDMDNLYKHHVMHSLSIAKFIHFSSGSQILDVGTGGGFPGIPLAIAFPDCRFHLTDSIGKKIKVVDDVCRQIKLNNVTTSHTRAEDIKTRYDFVVSRAVTTLPTIIQWVKNIIKKEQQNNLKNGLLYLKGGEFEDELKMLKRPFHVYSISQYFNDEFFETKKLVHVEL